MSLNPSNRIAQQMNPESHVFPNLARHVDGIDLEDKLKIFEGVDAQVAKELTEAGATDGDCLKADFGRIASGTTYKEVPTKHVGFSHGWKFERRWYYYAAEGPGIPPNTAEEFYRKWGTQVRVEGHCACPSPIEWCHGFAVGSYHIDTQEGLNAFVKLLATIDLRKRDTTGA